MLHRLEPADIVFTRGSGWISSAIRRLTRQHGEAETEANHVGIVVTPGTEETAVIVEALMRVECHTLQQSYGGTDDLVSVYRPLNLTEHDRRLASEEAKGYVGKAYGPFKLVLHALDWMLGGANVFRRLAVLDGFPICSYVVARAYGAAGYTFGVSAGAASPDDIADFCTSRTERFELVRAWAKVAE